MLFLNLITTVIQVCVATPIHISPSGFIYLPCNVNGLQGHCLLDTGSSSSDVLNKFVKGKPSGYSAGTGIGGGMPRIAFSYRIKEFRVLDQLTGIKKVIAYRSFPFPEQPDDLLGTIGGNALAHRILKIDTRSKQADFVAEKEGTCIPFNWLYGSPYLPLRSPSGNVLQTMLDTAAGASVLGPRFVNLAQLVSENSSMGDATNKKIKVRYGKLPMLLFDKEAILGVAVMDQPFAPEKVSGKQLDLILGLDYLSGKIFILDYKTNHFCIKR